MKKQLYTRQGQTQNEGTVNTHCHAESRPLPLGRAPEGFCRGSHKTVSASHPCFPLHLRERMPAGQVRGYLFGFTLIEMLVAVLILGILAAVAVPQYQKAVLKSRFVSMMPVAKTLAGANEVYYAEHDAYATDPAKLDVTRPAETPDGTAVLMYSNPEEMSFVRVNNPSVPNAQYVVYQSLSKNFPNTTWCEAGDTRAEEMCVALGGVLPDGLTGNSSGTDGWKAYLLSGDSTGGHFTPACPENATCDSSGNVTACGEEYYIKNNACATYEHVGDVCEGEGSNCDNSGFLWGACVAGASCEGSTFVDGACAQNASCPSSMFRFTAECAENAICNGSTFEGHAYCSSWSHCVDSQFRDESSCGSAICTGSIFSGNSMCIYYSNCAESTFNDSSYCDEGSTCTGSTFRENAVCSGKGCDRSDGTTYEGNACCTTGGDCPPCP